MVTQHIQVAQNLRPDWAEADQLRLTRYSEARDFYAGDQWVGKAKMGERRMVLNYARALTKKVASYVFPSPVTFTVWPRSSAEDEAANRVERELADVLDQLKADELDHALCVEASTIGDAAIKVTWDVLEQRPQIGQVDPATLVVEYDPTLPTRVFRAYQRYSLPGYAIAGALGLSADQVQAIAPTGLYPIEEDWTDERLVIKAAGQKVRDEVNPYGWIPYVVLANDRAPRNFWGTSDLEDLYDVGRELNSRVSVLSKVLELSGAPIAVLENVDGSEGVTVAPGAKWEIPEGAKAYLLDLLAGNGVRLHIEYIQQLYQAMHDLSETPRTAFGDSGRSLSGAALEVEIQPLVQRVKRKRRAFRPFYQRRNHLLLDLMERFGGQDLAGMRQTRPEWPSILPSDEETMVRNSVSLVGSGIQSRQTSLAKLGNTDPQRELQLVAEEAERMAAIAAPDDQGKDQKQDDRKDQ